MNIEVRNQCINQYVLGYIVGTRIEHSIVQYKNQYDYNIGNLIFYDIKIVINIKKSIEIIRNQESNIEIKESI